ncbi:ribosomal-protein-alanine N-acetyltransferase [Loktanella fryxellensis]|uniref:Ribosomal-protein-alanine N-acetyltransferase n=1 Tax=Loktanella fryxellensis TaxID=245187 RepID=A0A1H8DD90_9RHOB|nr:GNAT family N-acetyltransferase [Loktanella fryxellensis]SEN05331.1 ribosomal-protein-alanine N-acetyltransferase [Loktanella fryxellensis]
MTPTALAQTHRRAFDHDRPWSALEFADLLAQRGVILCGSADSFVLGRVTFDEAEVMTLATLPEQRRMGLARAALTDFLGRAARAGAASVFLEVAADNAAAIALYAAQDFASVGRRRAYYARTCGAAVDALVLRRAVADAAA